jgi:mRNA-degrading endonuclease RelE of RelBE toxin-antitoxin system
MNYNIETTDDFDKQVKRLAKKYRSLKNDLLIFQDELLANPYMGTDLGNNTRKARMTVASKNKGKSGGARIITFQILIDIQNTDIYLLAIYDKNEQESISEQKIQQIKTKNGLVG